MDTNITDEIMDILNSRKDTSEATPEPEAVPEPELALPVLKGSGWVKREDGTEEKLELFSKKYWKPKTVPDHLVKSFKGYDAGKLPDLYIPPVKEFEKYSLTLSLGLKVNVVGPTGAGKTLMAEYYASTTGRPCLRIDHSVELDRAAVFGQVHITGGDTDFVPGVLPLSMTAPTLVILDELARATGYSNVIYQRVLDRRELYMPEMKDAGINTIIPDEDWLICASDNTKGNGDDMDKYSASNVQDASFINRWDIVIEQDYLTAREESKLVEALFPEMRKEDSRSLVKFSTLIHAGFKKGDISTAFSPRNIVCIVKLMKAGVGIKEAVDMNYISRCSVSEASDVRESLRSAFGE